jgi:hypothetical protein
MVQSKIDRKMCKDGLKKVYDLKNGGVLENGHVRFHEETFEKINQDKEVPNMRKRK